MSKFKKVLLIILLLLILASGLYFFVSCQGFRSKLHQIKGTLFGCTYNCTFYSNDGDLFMTVKGDRIDMESNIVKEQSYNDTSGWGYSEAMSSVVTITIDGKQIESCGSTILFAEETLKPDVNFRGVDAIDSNGTGITSLTSVAGIINKYKNYFGKGTVVVIQSQLGDPICAYSGSKVYWEVCEDLPKTTKLMIDGKALYIHRANFQVIDKALLK